jgi:hypothetical protein
MIRQGIPHSVRPQIWMRISGSLEKKLKSDTSYKIIVKASSNDHLMTSKQIEKVGIMSDFFIERFNKRLFVITGIIVDYLSLHQTFKKT